MFLVDEILRKDLDLAKYSLWVFQGYAALSTPVSYIQLGFTHCSARAGNAELAFLISAWVFCCSSWVPREIFCAFLDVLLLQRSKILKSKCAVWLLLPNAAFGSYFFTRLGLELMFSKPQLQPGLGKNSLLFSACSERWMLPVGCVLQPASQAWVVQPWALLPWRRKWIYRRSCSSPPRGVDVGREERMLTATRSAPRRWRGAAICYQSRGSAAAPRLHSGGAQMDWPPLSSPSGHGQAWHVWLQGGQKWDPQAPGGVGASRLCPALQPRQVGSVVVGCSGTGWSLLSFLPKAGRKGKAIPGRG